MVSSTLEKREKLIDSLSQRLEGEMIDTERPSPSRHKDVFHNFLNDFPIPCSSCGEKLDIEVSDRHGNSSVLVKCTECDFQKEYSPKCHSEGKHFTEYNVNLVYESFEDGRGFAGYHKVCAALGHDPLPKKEYYKIKNEIGSKIFDKQTSKLDLMYRCLVAYYEKMGIYPDGDGRGSPLVNK